VQRLAWKKEKPSAASYDQCQPEITGYAPPFVGFIADFPLQRTIPFIFG
jgi:hypothetical protein